MDNKNKYSYAEHVENRQLFLDYAIENFSLKALKSADINHHFKMPVYRENPSGIALSLTKFLPNNEVEQANLFRFAFWEAYQDNFNDESFYSEDKKLSADEYARKALNEFYKTLIEVFKNRAFFVLEVRKKTLMDKHSKKYLSSKKEFKLYFKHEYSFYNMYPFTPADLERLASCLTDNHLSNIFAFALFNFYRSYDFDNRLSELEKSDEFSNLDLDEIYDADNYKLLARKLTEHAFMKQLAVVFSDAIHKKITSIAEAK